MVYCFGHLPLEYLQIILALGRSHLVLCFAGNGPFLCPSGLGDCSSCEVRLRSYIVGFLPDWRACLYWHSHCSFGSSGCSCFHNIPNSPGMVGHGSPHCWMIVVWIVVGSFVLFGCLVILRCCGAILDFWLLGWRGPLGLHRILLEVLLQRPWV